jgi:putative FmdB family regulatory protein
MPFYEYRCASCGHQFTLLRPMSEATTAANCPACGATETERLISACAIGSASGGPGGGFS